MVAKMGKRTMAKIITKVMTPQKMRCLRGILIILLQNNYTIYYLIDDYFNKLVLTVLKDGWLRNVQLSICYFLAV